jgi:hypothetical protein
MNDRSAALLRQYISSALSEERALRSNAREFEVDEAAGVCAIVGVPVGDDDDGPGWIPPKGFLLRTSKKNSAD